MTVRLEVIVGSEQDEAPSLVVWDAPVIRRQNANEWERFFDPFSIPIQLRGPATLNVQFQTLFATIGELWPQLLARLAPRRWNAALR